MIAIIGGLGAALVFATATICSSRSSRMIGAHSVLAWVMMVGLVITAPSVALSDAPRGLDLPSFGWLGLAGAANVLGLLLAYSALRIGKVGIVAPIVSTEGAVAAVISVVAGETLAPAAQGTLALIVAGILMAAISPGDNVAFSSSWQGRPFLLAMSSAMSFGVSLYLTGRLGVQFPIMWVLLPARVVGVFAVAVPLTLSRRLRLTRRAVPLVLTSGVCEILGFGLFALGARHSIAISAVLASQFAAIAAIAAFVIFRERLARVQVAGVATIAIGVAALSALRS